MKLLHLIFILFTSTSLFAQGCWSQLELSELEQRSLDDISTFSFKDSIDCTPLSKVRVNFLGKEFVSDENGTLIMPTPPEDFDSYVPIHISKKGYISSKQTVPVSLGNYWKRLYVMSKEMPLNSARFILSWGNKPKDLDLHLKSDDFHISYRKTRSIANKVKLDRDARQGYGPETITLTKLRSDKTYKVLIHRYSNEGNINQKTNLSTYINNTFDKVVYIPNTHERCIQVAEIKNKKISYKTKIVDDSNCK